MKSLVPISATNTEQFIYSATKEAVAHYLDPTGLGGGWKFLGWLWEGDVTSVAKAESLVEDYLCNWGLDG